MKVLGITGSIGMGKSTVNQLFADEGVPVWDADEAVLQVYHDDKEAIEDIRRQFGDEVIDKGRVDKSKLKSVLAAKPELKGVLEAIVHPYVGRHCQKFLAACKTSDHPLAALDIPLLFETKMESEVDHVVVVTASSESQRSRVLSRPGMSEAWFATIKSWQMSDEEKRKRADFVVISEDIDETRAQVQNIVDELT